MPDRTVTQIFDAWAAAQARADTARAKADVASQEYADALGELDALRAELSRRNKTEIQARRPLDGLLPR